MQPGVQRLQRNGQNGTGSLRRWPQTGRSSQMQPPISVHDGQPGSSDRGCNAVCAISTQTAETLISGSGATESGQPIVSAAKEPDQPPQKAAFESAQTDRSLSQADSLYSGKTDTCFQISSLTAKKQSGV
jgi:hypothetical protein